MSDNKKLLDALTALGFGTDGDINGADVVDVINAHYYELKASVDSDAKRYADSEEKQS